MLLRFMRDHVRRQDQREETEEKVNIKNMKLVEATFLQ